MSDNPGSIELDRDGCSRLLDRLNEGLADYYHTERSRGRAVVFEVLNALACAAAAVMAGTAPYGTEDCLAFFTEALQNQLNATLELVENHDMPTQEPSPSSH
jgi:hypothetical protein